MANLDHQQDPKPVVRRGGSRACDQPERRPAPASAISDDRAWQVIAPG
jgi:hypothetical protein